MSKLFLLALSPLLVSVRGRWGVVFAALIASIGLSSCGGDLGTVHVVFGPATPDTAAPSTPTGLTATAVSTSQINLSWTASTDNVAVTGYRVYRGGTLLAALGNVTTFQNTGLTLSTLYSYTVLAIDGAGNESGQSAAAGATTLATPDTTPPSVPTGLTATAVSTFQINLSWTASTDNVAVTGYRVYRGGTQIITLGAVTTFQNTGLTANTPYSYRVLAIDGAGNESGQSAAASATTLASGIGGVPRPAYNTGVGFFIGTDNKLYDANGIEFRMKGVNRSHYDGGSGAGIAKSKANAERWVLFPGPTMAQWMTQLKNENYNNNIVAIPGVWWTYPPYGGANVTCSSNTADFIAAVNQWVDQAADWNGSDSGVPRQRWMIINIANEWGASNSTVWRDQYIDAIKRLRGVHPTLSNANPPYGHTIMIDSGGCGQDFNNIINYGQAVFNADPQKNIIFGIHLYGNASSAISLGNGISNITKANPAVVTYTGNDGWVDGGIWNGRQIIITGVGGMTEVNSTSDVIKYFKVKNLNTTANTFELTDTNDVNINSTGYGTYTSGGMVGPNPGQAAFTAHLQTLVDTGLPLVIGEFGPGRNIGPSPTMVWPGQIITGANALNVGWLAWAWDDNNLGNGSSDDNGFAMVYQNSTYNTTADLTIFGKDVVLNPTYGLEATAVPATIFP